jgi:hypothetical protein
LFALLVGLHGAAVAQQNADCASCAGGTFPSMLGFTLTTSATHGPCDQSVPWTLDVNRFGRMWGIAGNRYNISLCNNTGNTFLYVTTNTTIPGVITCADDGCGVNNGPSSVSFVPSATTTYRIYVFNAAFGAVYPAGTNMEVLITCIDLNPPPNDLPCGAINLPINGTNCSYTFGDNQAATNSQAQVPGVGAPPSCTGALYQGADMWYSVTVPASGLIGIQTSEATLCAGAFQLYTATACNGTFTQLPGGCITSGLTGPTSQPATVFDAFAAGLTAGQTIYVRYWERNGNENGTFELCAYEAQRPINDEPCAPIALTLNTSCQPTQYVFENATPSAVTNPSCGGPTFNDIWFTFTVPNPLPANWTGISVNTSPNAPVSLGMAWYRLTTTPCAPGNLTQIACNATGNLNSANVSPTLLNAGETIYVRVWGTQPWFGSYEICAVLNQAPGNDDPCGAIPLAVNYGCIMQTFANSSATVTSTNPPGTVANGVPNPSCGAPVQGDVWFTVTVPPNGTVQLDMLAGSLTDAAMAVYRVLSGSCNTNNMLLQQIPAPQGCAVINSQQGPGNANMPYTSITGQVPGSTLYIRVWRQTGTDGTFSICARRTDNPPGNCYYVLTMQDSGGDGWGGSYVTVCIGGVCNNYTVLGSNASISIGANVGQVFTVSYTAAGANQGQNSYMITQYNIPVYVSSQPPQPGMVVNSTVSCNPPPAPFGDCMGATQLCSNATVPCTPWEAGSVSGEINAGNAGCMSGENMGRWMTIHFGPNTIPCSPAAFDIVGGNQVGCSGGGNNIFDFVLWGPYPTGSTVGTICPITQLPYRCNWASLSTPTIKGLAFNNSLPAYQYGGGGNMARHMVVNPGQVYMLFVNNWSSSGQQFQLQWKTPPAGFQVLASDCQAPATTPAPAGSVADVSCAPLPVEMITFDARAGMKQVDVMWSTASETGSSHYNVERSADGVSYTVIGRVDAAQFSLQTNNYTFIDEAPLTGLSYYRLQQVDLMENATHTHSVPVMFKGGQAVLDVFPNPADQTIWISFDMEKEAPMRWRISDASGRLVRENNILTASGKNQFELPIEKLEQGSYMIEVVHEDGSTLGVRRFVKQ